jgi:hypothetical protein
VNWRLPLLKQALQSGQAFALSEFLKKSPDYFATNAILSYAMSRYLVYASSHTSSALPVRRLEHGPASPSMKNPPTLTRPALTRSHLHA